MIVFDIDSLSEMLTIWNAGAPDSYLVNQQDKTVELIRSSHLPLGIQSPEKFEVKCQSFEFTRQHKIIAVTDGIIEAEDDQFNMFGEQRMIACVENNIAKDSICEALLVEVEGFCGKTDQSDDVSLLEVAFPSSVSKDVPRLSDGKSSISGTSDSSLSLKLRGKSLGNFDPIPLFLQALLSCNELLPHRARIFTVLSELYNNALDHGVLGLDSVMKNDSDGFTKYYKKRAQGLIDIDVGFVILSVDHHPTATGGRLVFDLTDSGSGFDVERIVREGSKNYSGRGLPLLLSLCDSMEYLNGGSRVKATYLWEYNDIPD